jgi:hypothetical protein
LREPSKWILRSISSEFGVNTAKVYNWKNVN